MGGQLEERGGGVGTLEERTIDGGWGWAVGVEWVLRLIHTERFLSELI